MAIVERSTVETVTMVPYHILRAAALVWAASAAAARAEDDVVRWTAVEHDVTPVPQSASQGYVARFRSDGSRLMTDEGGEKAETLTGQPAVFVTTLGTRHAIVDTRHGGSIDRTDTFQGVAIAMRIEPGGAGGCHVAIRYRQIRRHGAFESKRNDGSGPSTASGMDTTDARCSVTGPQS